MNDFPIETHPFAPVLPPRARVMMMGTFPPAAAKRCMAFHYPNFQNDMWRIYGLLFFNDAGYFQVAGEKRFDAGKIRDFLMAHNIALCPTVRRAVRERGNAFMRSSHRSGEREDFGESQNISYQQNNKYGKQDA